MITRESTRLASRSTQVLGRRSVGKRPRSNHLRGAEELSRSGGRVCCRAERGPEGPWYFHRQGYGCPPAGVDKNVLGEGGQKGAISASRRVEAPSRHRGDSLPSHDDVGGFFFEFEAIQTESLRAGLPRRSRTRRFYRSVHVGSEREEQVREGFDNRGAFRITSQARRVIR